MTHTLRTRADTDLDAKWARIEAGRQCPRCDERVFAARTEAMGLALWRCPICHKEWIRHG